MTSFTNPLRWCALPFVFIGAIILGMLLGWFLARVPLPHCVPRFAGFGAADGSVACGLLLVPSLLLKVGAPCIPGALAVLLCAATAPAHKGATACVVATGTCALLLFFFCVLGLLGRGAGWAAGAALGLAPWLAAWLVFRLVRWPPRYGRGWLSR